jgi:DNA-binding transcriptional LysR family regulator
MERILQNNGVSFRDIKIAGIFGSTDAVKQAVKAGLGFTILSKLSVADELQYRVLCEVKLLGIEKMTRTFFIATHKKRALPVAYKLFLEHLGNQSRRHQ